MTKNFTRNLNKLVITVLCVFIFVTNMVGQSLLTGSYHQLSVLAGRQSINDDHLDLSSANSNMKGLAWSYANNNAHQRKSLTIVYEYGNTNNYKTAGYLIEYKNAFSISKYKNNGFTNYIGYSVKSDYQYIRYAEQYSWTAVNALSLYNSLNYSWEKNAFSFDVSIPVIGFVSRPDPEKQYEGAVNSMLYNSLSNPVFVSFHNYKEIDLSLRYMRYISNRFVFTTGISFSDQKILTENRFSKKEYQYQAGLSYFLKGR